MHNRFLMRQVDRDVLPLRVTLQHAFEQEFAADAAFFVAAVGVTRALAQTLVDLNPTSLDRVSRTRRPAAQGAGRRMYADGRQAQRTQRLASPIGSRARSGLSECCFRCQPNSGPATTNKLAGLPNGARRFKPIRRNGRCSEKPRCWRWRVKISRPSMRSRNTGPLTQPSAALRRASATPSLVATIGPIWVAIRPGRASTKLVLSGLTKASCGSRRNKFSMRNLRLAPKAAASVAVTEGMSPAAIARMPAGELARRSLTPCQRDRLNIPSKPSGR